MSQVTAAGERRKVQSQGDPSRAAGEGGSTALAGRESLRGRVRTYAVAVLVALAAMGTTALSPSLRSTPMLVPGAAAVVVFTLGVRAGLLALVISAAGTMLLYWHQLSSRAFDPAEAIRIGVLAGMSLMMHRLVTSRTRALSATRASEARFRSIVERAADGAAVVRSGQLVYANQALAALHGVEEPAQLLNRARSAQTGLDEVALVREHAARWLRGESLPERYTLQLRGLTDGTVRHVSLSVADITWDGALAWLVMVHDLTGQRRADEAETERARLDAALMVARTVAHELNNALAPVTGYAELLERRPSVTVDPVAVAFAQRIGEAAAASTEIIDRLQRIARLEEAPSPVDPAKPVLDLQRSTAPKLP